MRSGSRGSGIAAAAMRLKPRCRSTRRDNSNPPSLLNSPPLKSASITRRPKWPKSILSYLHFGIDSPRLSREPRYPRQSASARGCRPSTDEVSGLGVHPPHRARRPDATPLRRRRGGIVTAYRADASTLVAAPIDEVAGVTQLRTGGRPRCPSAACRLSKATAATRENAGCSRRRR